MDIAYGLAAEVHLARFALLGSDDRDGSRRQEHALPELHRCHVQQVGQRHTRNAEMAEADNDSFAVRFIRRVIGVTVAYITLARKQCIESVGHKMIILVHVSGLHDRIFRPEIIVIEIPVCIEHIRKKIPRNPALSGLRIKDRRIKLPQPRKNFGLAARIFQRKRSRILRTSERRAVKIGDVPFRRPLLKQLSLTQAFFSQRINLIIRFAVADKDNFHKNSFLHLKTKFIVTNFFGKC